MGRPHTLHFVCFPYQFSPTGLVLLITRILVSVCLLFGCPVSCRCILLVMLSASVGCSVAVCSGHAISVGCCSVVVCTGHAISLCWLFCDRMFWSCYQRLLAVLWSYVLVMLSASVGCSVAVCSGHAVSL